MDKTYSHQKVEEKWYRFWEESGFFTPRPPRADSGQAPKKKPFCIIMPPPNANGSLHMGHALFVTIQDILTRYHRMLGEVTLWLPGADHAGILTQVVFEKELSRQSKTRFDLGREEFYRQCYQFSQKNKQYMYKQLKRLGASCDWTREKFTLDPGIEKVVMETFKKLYEDGLIYKGDRIINWCPRCGTALSDLEVTYKEKKDSLYYMKYGPFIIATVRPETKFGDTAVAVNPKDGRYKNLIGQEFIYESLIGSRKMRVVADEAVDPKFGTGAEKVTPGHDSKDFEIAQRHGLPILQVIDLGGRLNKNTGRFAGLTVEKARKKVVEELKARGDIVKIDQNYIHSVGACYRCEATIEPQVLPQWFVKTNSKFKVQSSKLEKELGVEEASLAELGILAVKKGLIKIIPRRFEKIYFQWMENIKDWCISRQIWWGYKIPIDGEEDTLDTWFSSAQWPFATLRASPYKKDFDYFYPTSVMETGYEILFFWVARMIMLGIYRTGEVPFKTIYLHGLVRDALGQKMSKSKGNVIDPLDVADKYGADAVRFALIWGTSAGHDSNISEDKIRGMRNFSNKLWNIGRFILLNLGGKSVPWYENGKMGGVTATPIFPSKEDRAILNDLNYLIKGVTKNLNNFRFSQATSDIYEFLWHKFADKYIESSKKRIQEGDLVVLSILRHVYLNCLKLLHPFMPFITEEIWGKFEGLWEKNLIVSSWPKTD